MDSSQSKISNGKSQNQDDQGQQPAAPVAQTPVSVSKEQGPVASAPIPDAVPAEITAAPETPELSQEVKEAGVEATAQKPDIHPDIQKVGVTHSQESVPAPSQASAKGLPMTGVQATQQLKQHPSVFDSMRWFLSLILKQDKEKDTH